MSCLRLMNARTVLDNPNAVVLVLCQHWQHYLQCSVFEVQAALSRQCKAVRSSQTLRWHMANAWGRASVWVQEVKT